VILPIIFSILSPRPEHYPARDEVVNFKEEALARHLRPGAPGIVRTPHQ